MHNYNFVNVENSINSGQVFLWKKFDNNYWYGINGQNVLRSDNFGNIKSLHDDDEIDFFRNKDNIKNIIKTISKDSTIKYAIKKYLGLRLLEQDPFQCMISFIMSTNSNIQKIKSSLQKLTVKCGKKIKFDKQEFFLFPRPKDIADLSINEIVKCGTGYRSKFIKNAAKMVLANKINFDDLEIMNYSEAKNILCTIPGIGNKVADCIMLFSLNKLEAFPLDRWMIRILREYYFNEFQLSDTRTITDKQYNIIHEKIIDYFGVHAGYAQQFLFKMEREKNQKKW